MEKDEDLWPERKKERTERPHPSSNGTKPRSEKRKKEDEDVRCVALGKKPPPELALDLPGIPPSYRE